MNPTAVNPRLAAASVICLALAACSQGGDVPAKPAPPPKDAEKIKRADLLTAPKEDLLKSSAKASDYPELKVKTVKVGEGEDVLDWGEIGVIHLKGHLATGKEFMNTYSLQTPNEVVMMEWGEIPGLVLGAVGMKKGEIRTLTVPPALAYGKAGDAINGVKPNATVFLRVELEDIKQLDAGFQVRRKKAGAGDPVRAGQQARFHYTGVLGDTGDREGEQFDSSQGPGGAPLPVTVGPMGQVVEGWQKGLLGMRPGETRWLRIPGAMGYGSTGRGEIPPDATLIFEVTLESIEG